MNVVRTADVFGVPVRVGETSVTLAALRATINARKQAYVCCANVHVIETSQRDATLARALREAEFVTPDGAPVAWLAGRISGVRTSRLTGSDLFEDLCSHEGYAHFFLGSTPDTLSKLQLQVAALFPQARVVGSHSPAFGQSFDVEGIASLINDAQPDIVWVGLGAPRQEIFMSQLRSIADAPLFVGVGAVFDFYSGARRRAPEWVQRLGGEWLFRLLAEPSRLWRRYLTTNTSFVLRVLRSYPTLRRRSLDRAQKHV